MSIVNGIETRMKGGVITHSHRRVDAHILGWRYVRAVSLKLKHKHPFYTNIKNLILFISWGAKNPRLGWYSTQLNLVEARMEIKRNELLKSEIVLDQLNLVRRKDHYDVLDL